MADLDLKTIRERLGLTQAEFAAMLGFSIRAIQSCEQGWRQPSPALEKTALLLYIARQQGAAFGSQACWEAQGCSEEARAACVAYKSSQGHLCWFLHGTLCGATSDGDWEHKRSVCIKCKLFLMLLGEDTDEAGILAK